MLVDPNWTDQEIADALAREVGEDIMVYINHQLRKTYAVKVSDYSPDDEGDDIFIRGRYDLEK